MAIPAFTMRQLLEAGVHFGHHTRRWNPQMRQYIFGVRNGVHILDLQQTQPMMQTALTEIRNIVSKGGRILFVGTKRQAQEVVKESAERCGQYYVNHRWLGGMLTNFATVRKSIKKMGTIEKMETDGTFDRLSKKERLMKTREKAKLEKFFKGISTLNRLPSAIFIVDIKKEHIAVSEAKKLNIPTFAMVDTNSNPNEVDFPIPSNDDAAKSIQLIIGAVCDAISEGLSERKQKREDERISEEADRQKTSDAEGDAKEA